MNWLKKHNYESPNKKFINDLTFREVYELVTELTEKLSSYVKAERRVAIYSNNSVTMALFFLALQLLGKEVLMLNTNLTEAESIAVIMNTSATTGEFKSVPLRWEQFYAHVKASRKSFGVTMMDNWLLVSPMYHISGLTILMRSLYNGTQMTILEK